MAKEIINQKRSKSVIRITGNTDTSVTLNELSTNTDIETVVTASITHISTASDGWVRVYRGDSAAGTLVLELYGSNDWPLGMYDIAISNTSSSNIFVTNSGAGGTVLMTLSKYATYSVDADTGAAL